MSGNKTCNKCGKKSLGWDYDFNKKTKKWKLENHKRQDGKWCNKPREEKTLFTVKKTDIVKCELCLGNSGFCYTPEVYERHPELGGHTLEEHMKIFHKNNEVLDDVDMMALSDNEKHEFRKMLKHSYTLK